MRAPGIAVAFIIIIGLGLWLWQDNYRRPAVGKQLVLANLPGAYCPQTLWLVVAELESASGKIGAILFDGDRPVESCRFVSLEGIAIEPPVTIRLKTAFALGTEKIITSTESELSVPLEFGDLNGDNAIDHQDEAVVRLALGGKSQLPENDLDRDGRVTILDLGLVRLNQKNGQPRPDRESWSESVR